MKKHNRRSFVKSSALVGTGLLVWPNYLISAKPKTGIQLYTLRDKMAKDPKGTLEKIAAIGYKEVESAGYADGQYYGYTASDFKKLLADNGLKMISGHYSTGDNNSQQKGSLTNGWERAVEDAAIAGQKYMVLAYLPEDRRKTLDNYKAVAELLNSSAEICKKQNIQFCYHNHSFEFKKIEGQVPYDILLNETDKSLVKMEMDLYWVVKAGREPLELFNSHPGRFPLWHVKDMDSGGDFAAVGTGTIDFNRIFEAKRKAGMEHFFVEQDKINGDPYDTVQTSYNNVQKVI